MPPIETGPAVPSTPLLNPCCCAGAAGGRGMPPAETAPLNPCGIELPVPCCPAASIPPPAMIYSLSKKFMGVNLLALFVIACPRITNAIHHGV